MTVRELINALLGSNMDSDVKVLLSFDDANIVIDEGITEIIETSHNFEDATLQIDIPCNHDEWIETEKA